jgi:hypothetical protein
MAQYDYDSKVINDILRGITDSKLYTKHTTVDYKSRALLKQHDWNMQSRTSIGCI